MLPDNNRIWYSVGLTNNVTPGVSVDLAYSFVDVQNATVNDMKQRGFNVTG